jgi:hypothetical protein
MPRGVHQSAVLKHSHAKCQNDAAAGGLLLGCVINCCSEGRTGSAHCHCLRVSPIPIARCIESLAGHGETASHDRWTPSGGCEAYLGASNTRTYCLSQRSNVEVRRPHSGHLGRHVLLCQRRQIQARQDHQVCCEDGIANQGHREHEVLRFLQNC